MASVRDRYELEIDLLLREHQRGPTDGFDALAFEASERARARSFLDGLAQARAGIHEGASTTLLERERLTARELSAAALKLQSLPLDADHAQRESISRAIDALALEYREVEAQIRADSPRYAALVQPKLLSLRETQQLLGDEDSVLLQYFVGRSHSYVWAVTAREFSCAILPPGKDLNRLVQRFTATVSSVPGSGPGQHPAAAAPTRGDEGRELSEALLAPVAPYLSNRRLLVVADGTLQGMPFAALPDPRSLSAPRLTPLLAIHEIVNLPSISTVALLRGAWNRGHEWPKPLMILADPVFEADDPRLGASLGQARPAAVDASRPLTRALRDIGSSTGSGPSRLLATRQEARGIAALVPGTEVAMDFSASRVTVLALASGQHRIVHFATHGIADSQHQELSGVVLSLYDREGKFQDGFLRLPDIYNLRMPADLVVLSACNTGLGQEVTGEGLAGLVRGFMYAGSRRVLASLWRVDDEATAELMQKFYQNLLVRRLSAGDALRTAQLELRKIPRWRHPFYWAAFVLQGDWTEESRPN
jgi:CHAT domain-containing protein